MKKILITGDHSYIGTSFEKHLMQWPDRYQVDTINMRGDEWRNVSFSEYDAVYHVAGIAHSDYGKISAERADLYYRVNTHLAVETAKKAKADGVKQFIFMSSASVYGESAPIGKDKVVYRDTPVSPVNSYGDSKVQAENGIMPLQDDHFKVAVLRPPMIYGKGCKGNYSTLTKLAKKLPIFPYVDNQRSMLYIENLVEFVRLVVDNEEQGIFWPQNNEYTNTSEMVKMIAQVHNKRVLMIKGLNWALKIMSHVTGLVNKAFGSLRYDHEMSRYKQDYCVRNLADSIRETEQL
jgi:UDP-glucose 4-epimerase